MSWLKKVGNVYVLFFDGYVTADMSSKIIDMVFDDEYILYVYEIFFLFIFYFFGFDWPVWLYNDIDLNIKELSTKFVIFAFN